MPVYFICSEQIDNNNIEIDPELSHHLRDVLRVKVGKSLTLVDEVQNRYTTRVMASYPDLLLLEIESKESKPVSLRPHIHLGIGLLKGDKMDWVVQKATELGVSRLTPLMTQRTVVKTRPERAISQQKRWMKIATEASQQSCRWDIPQIDVPIEYNSFLKENSKDGFRLIFSEKQQHETQQKIVQRETARAPYAGTLIIGPEGGWETSEISEALDSKYLPVSLGEQILRAETAALAALAIVHYEMKNGHC